MVPTRSVVITGASRGLGLASAKRLYDEGWTVVAAMRSVRTGLENLRAAWFPGGRCSTYRCATGSDRPAYR